MPMLGVLPVAMRNAVFCIVYSFIMLVVDAIDEHIVETCSCIGLVTTLYV